MQKKLVIVESPAKARTISKYLGSSYTVMSSMGHIIDLPRKKLGIEIDQAYKADFVVISGKKKILSELKKIAKTADVIYFATDPDREGEAIGWNIRERMSLKGKKVLRVEFHEITKDAIEAAFHSPRPFDEDKIKAQLARRILDRLVGYFLSPLLWRKVTRGLSAGRVQSVALRLVVEREKEIQSFTPKEYWTVEADLKKKGEQTKEERKSFLAILDKIDGQKAQIVSSQEASDIVSALQDKELLVEAITHSTRTRNPQAPFITSSLQQEAFNKLRFSAVKTMFVAQQLYEGIELGQEGPVGLITYMRTDSVNVAKTALDSVRSFISKTYGKAHLPEGIRTFKSRRLAQEAHEAIRPTSVTRRPDQMQAFLTPEQFKLYDLIWKRFVASQMSAAKVGQTAVVIRCAQYLFKATGSSLVFDGFLALYKEEDDGALSSKKAALPSLSKGEVLTAVKILPVQHFTKPPARYSEGSLIRTLEEKGVGRPSTYAPTISTIVSRDYVRREKGYLFPTDLGLKVSDLLVEYFPRTMNISFTARMEEELDQVEEGKIDWVNILNEFYVPFKKKLDYAAKHIKKEIIYSDEVCPDCGKQMVVKWGRKGKFLSCSGYPACKYAKSISSGVKCPATGCGGDLILRRSFRGRSFYGCSRFPDCRFTSRDLPEEKPQDTAQEKSQSSAQDKPQEAEPGKPQEPAEGKPQEKTDPKEGE